MSATFHLYIPTELNDKKYHIPVNEKSEEDYYLGGKGGFCSTKDTEKHYDSFERSHFSAIKKHFSSYVKREEDDRALYEKLKKDYMEEFNMDLGRYKIGYHYKISFDEIAYYQGWFLRDKFFKHAYTARYAFTKKDTIQLLKSNLRFKNNKDALYRNSAAKKCLEYFISKIKDLSDGDFMFEIKF